MEYILLIIVLFGCFLGLSPILYAGELESADLTFGIILTSIPIIGLIIGLLIRIFNKSKETPMTDEEKGLYPPTVKAHNEYKKRMKERDLKDKETSKKEKELVEICKNKLPSFIKDNFQIKNCSKCNDRYFQLIDVNSDFSAIQLFCARCGKKKWDKIDESPQADSLDINIHQELFENLRDAFFPLDEEKVLNIESNADSKRSIKKTESKRHSISQNVKDKVWNRDDGKCVECGSNENLEFDHIIPHSKGGANTYRNIQLLCEPCNRSKSAKIG